MGGSVSKSGKDGDSMKAYQYQVKISLNFANTSKCLSFEYKINDAVLFKIV